MAQINKERILNLIKQIKETGYSYTPVYGGFIENKGTPDEENVYERSFIVYNHDRKGNVGDFEKLKTLAIKWCNEFNQDSVLVKEPGQPPRYLTKTGDVDMEFTGDTAFNDYAQEYFTDLHKNTHKYKDEDGRTPTRFSSKICKETPSCLQVGEELPLFLSLIKLLIHCKYTNLISNFKKYLQLSVISYYLYIETQE